MHALTNPRRNPIRQYPDLALRYVCRPVSDGDWAYVRDHLGPTLIASVATGALGLAASQLGCGLRVFAFRTQEGDVQVAVNPQLELAGETTLRSEKCLSLGTLTALVWRPRDVQMRAQDLHGEDFTLDASDLWGRVLQHENDHLQGHLIIDFDRAVDPLSLSITAQEPVRFPQFRPLKDPVERLLSETVQRRHQ